MVCTNTNVPQRTRDAIAANDSCDVEYVSPAELVVNEGRTSDNVVKAINVASAALAPPILNDCWWCRTPPMSRHRPMRPLQMIMMAEKTVSRGTEAVSGPQDSMMETMRATSMMVTAKASTKVPNGSPTRCATTSA